MTAHNSQLTNFPRLTATENSLLGTAIVTLYNLCIDHSQKTTQLYYCVTNITPWTSHVTPSQYCWSDVIHLCGSVFTEP
jgi:hypothetical protein